METGKTCIACGERKQLDEFYRHPQMADGHLGKCKECQKAAVRKNYAEKRDRYAAYERKRNKTPERKAKSAQYIKKRRRLFPEKAKAWNAVSNAVRDGRLARGPCAVCGSTVRVQAHHHDYNKPLDVEWLCFRCHREERHGQTTTQAKDTP